MGSNTVTITLIAKDQTQKAFSSITSGLQKLAKVATVATAAAGAALIKFTGDSIMAAARVDELRVVNQQLAKVNGLTAKSVTNAAQAVRNMGIEAGVAETVVAKFIQNQLDVSKAADIARIAQDAAVISGQNSTEALDGLTQGLITLQPEVLRTYGLFVDTQLAYKEHAKQLKKNIKELTTAEKQQALLNMVMEKGEDIAGAYEAAMGTASKQIRSWPRYIDDIKVAFGGLFDDAFKGAVGKVSTALKGIGSFVTDFSRSYARSGDVFASLRTAIYETFGSETATMLSKFVSKFEGIFKSLQAGDIQPLLDSLGELWVTITQRIKDGVAQVDWNELSVSIANQIDKINWSPIADSMIRGVENILQALWAFLSNVNWLALLDSVTMAVSEFILGMFGTTFEETRVKVDAFWADVFASFSRWLGAIVSVIQNGINLWRIYITSGLGAAGVAAVTIIMGWKPKFDQSMRDIAKMFFSRASGWMQQIIRGINAGIGGVLSVVADFVGEINSLLASISMPSFNFSGMVGGMSSGATVGNKKKKDKRKDMADQEAHGGGVFSGPLSGHNVELHGTEGVFTQEQMAHLAPASGGGGVTINLTYAPGFSTASAEELEMNLMPIIRRGILQTRGTAQ